MKTWHGEALVIGPLLALAWMVDQVVAGSVDGWSLPALVLLYVGTRQASIADRKMEVTPPARLDLIRCLHEGKRYDLISYCLGMVMAWKPLVSASWESIRHGQPFAPTSFGVLAIVALFIRIGYPIWRRRWRKRRPLELDPAVAPASIAEVLAMAEELIRERMRADQAALDLILERARGMEEAAQIADAAAFQAASDSEPFEHVSKLSCVGMAIRERARVQP